MTKMTELVPGAAPVAASEDPAQARAQVAALCWRKNKGRKEVLLVTSRDTGRWIVPKGWLIDGLSAAQSAMREAWEEAGVRGDPKKARLAGQFRYDKALDGGREVPVRADLYEVRVGGSDIRNHFPEERQRMRIWVTPGKAAGLVEEPELQDILRRF